MIEKENAKAIQGGGLITLLRSFLFSEEKMRWVYLFFGLFIIVGTMWRLQFATDAICCGDFDGYYHIRWSSLLWESMKSGQLLPQFNWLPLTVLNSEGYADHHYLFHLLQIPFLWFFDDVTAAKVAAVVFGSGAVFSIYWLLFRYRVKYLLVWLFALMACASPFFYRMNMAKAPPLTIVFTVIGIVLLFERRYLWLLPLMFLFVWTYSLFPLLFIAAVIWTGLIVWNERVFKWQPIFYSGLGLILGNVINPYFPDNLKLFYEHFATKFNVAGDFIVSVGGEWYPYSAQEMLTYFPVAMGAMLIGYIFFTFRQNQIPEKSGFLLIFVTILLAAQFRSKRFAEYFPPFAILFASFSIKDFFFQPRHSLPPEFLQDLTPLLDEDSKIQLSSWRQRRTYIAWGLGLFFFGWTLINVNGIDLRPYAGDGWKGWPLIRNVFSVRQEGIIETISANDGDQKYRGAGDWARLNIPKGERIFNCNWDDFPKLFFVDTNHQYVYGLDPNYLYSVNPELFKLMVEITSGSHDDAAELIRENFGARFIFSDAKENELMLRKGIEAGQMKVVFEDDDAKILEIITAEKRASD